MDRVTPSAFHQGEQAAQERVGVRDKMAPISQRVFRDFMPEQHRELFTRLPYLVVGGLDGEHQPWASLLFGDPGFITSPDARQLRISARPRPEDPLASLLTVEAPVGLLGIELATRRRNRANGRIAQVDDGGFSVAIEQSFGNCPKYIQARMPDTTTPYPASDTPSAGRRSDRLDRTTAAIVDRADTLFIASAHPASDERGMANQGVDVSHRGGPPGFVQAEADGRHLALPDYAGNFFFNTLGNLLLNPRAGLVVPDFASGDLLVIATDARIDWQATDDRRFPGAQRLVRLAIREVTHLERAMPWRWSGPEPSPYLPSMARY
ncbi:flavin-nucleotide-binding protein [Marinobacter halodurans]|uniref:Flavin-nucleotide-binding protein n=1 Tax=Marinobacter halodurans TaxID=2528979 RepID=A0ABY1ZE78_9GAMM|nr:pyridoxamine 5'-phosphate oxidase family protein [Marinobacter halodurans]TBW48125.1 flavin-nucleotide-binding protein [Marinobacter halodurans]